MYRDFSLVGRHPCEATHKKMQLMVLAPLFLSFGLLLFVMKDIIQTWSDHGVSIRTETWLFLGMSLVSFGGSLLGYVLGIHDGIW